MAAAVMALAGSQETLDWVGLEEEALLLAGTAVENAERVAEKEVGLVGLELVVEVG